MDEGSFFIHHFIFIKNKLMNDIKKVFFSCKSIIMEIMIIYFGYFGLYSGFITQPGKILGNHTSCSLLVGKSKKKNKPQQTRTI